MIHDLISALGISPRRDLADFAQVIRIQRKRDYACAGCLPFGLYPFPLVPKISEIVGVPEVGFLFVALEFWNWGGAAGFLGVHCISSL